MASFTPADFKAHDQAQAAAPSLQEMYEQTMREFNGAPEPAAEPAETPAAVPPKSGPIYWIVAASAITVALVAVVMLVRSMTAPLPAATPAPLAATTQALPGATSAPQAPEPTPRAPLAPGLALYWAPGGDLAPSLPTGTAAYTPTARYHGEWVQLVVAGYESPVWARADAVPGAALEQLADLAPPPTSTPAPIVVVKQVQAPAPPPVVLDCTRDRATFFAKRSDLVGSVEAWSCESQAAAEAQADVMMAELKAQAGRN